MGSTDPEITWNADVDGGCAMERTKVINLDEFRKAREPRPEEYLPHSLSGAERLALVTLKLDSDRLWNLLDRNLRI
jgi:hypothetical protein